MGSFARLYSTISKQAFHPNFIDLVVYCPITQSTMT